MNDSALYLKLITKDEVAKPTVQEVDPLEPTIKLRGCQYT